MPLVVDCPDCGKTMQHLKCSVPEKNEFYCEPCHQSIWEKDLVPQDPGDEDDDDDEDVE